MRVTDGVQHTLQYTGIRVWLRGIVKNGLLNDRVFGSWHPVDDILRNTWKTCTIQSDIVFNNATILLNIIYNRLGVSRTHTSNVHPWCGPYTETSDSSQKCVALMFYATQVVQQLASRHLVDTPNGA